MNSQYTITLHKDLIILNPTSKHTQTLLFLHGWGESGDLWTDYFASKDILPQGTKVLLPTAPLRYTEFYEKEAPAWTALYTLNHSQEDINIITDMKMVGDIAEHFHKVMDSEINLLRDSTRFFIGGFSMGGFVSSHLWKTYKKTLGGLILYSCATGKNVPWNSEQEYSPVLWAHGVEDSVIKYRHGEYCNYSLENKKRKFVHVKVEGLGHGADQVVQVETKAFFEEILLKPML